MKHFLFLAAVLAAFGLASCASTPASAEKAPEAKVVQLAKGAVKVYEFKGITLHAYRTNDALSDESFLLETKQNLVAIESPAFDANIREFMEYAKALKKPLTDILLSNHPNGIDRFESVKSHLTNSVVKAISPGGATRGLIDNFVAAFGAEFNGSLPALSANLASGKVNVGGIEFIITETGTAYDIEIPSINSVYTHMLGGNVHSILASSAHMDEIIKTLESYTQKRYALILSSHHEPESLADVTTKIAYIKKAKEFAGKYRTAGEFITAMKAAFPGYLGENYLEMSAGILYPAAK